MNTVRIVSLNTLRAQGLQGAPDLGRALYAYPHEHYAFWQTVRAQARVQPWGEVSPPGLLGEDLTISGLLESGAWVGDRLCFGRCALGISGPRKPCAELDVSLGFGHARKMMLQSGFCGFFLSVLEEGPLQAGEVGTVVPGPRQVSVTEIFRGWAQGRPIA